MIKYIYNRFFSMIPMLLGVSFIVFILMYLTPGDVLSQARASQDISKEYIMAMEKLYGLDQPWYVQYVLWLKNALCFNFGESWTYKIPVSQLLLERVPITLLLTFSSLILTWIIAIPLGVLAAVYKDSFFDRITALFAYASLSVPDFFLALLAVLFAAKTGIFPIGGQTSLTHEFMPFAERFLDLAHHLVLPSLVLAIGGVAGIMRVMRANFLDYIRADYVTTARAKGLSERVIFFKHVLRNAMNPLITSIGFAFSGLLSGALLVENIMNYPGLGQLLFNAFMKQDQHLVMASVLMSCFMLMLGNLLADILLACSDPRVRLAKKTS